MASLSEIIDEINDNPMREIGYYTYPELYEFYHSRVLDRDLQVELLQRFQPNETTRVLELGCGTGPLLARIEDEYDTVLGVDRNAEMLAVAKDKLEHAEALQADFRNWSGADNGRVFDVAVVMGGLLHLTENEDVRALAETVYTSLREGGTFGSFFVPLSNDIDNGWEDTQRVESDRYSLERQSVSALTSANGHYTTVHYSILRDTYREKEARVGMVFHGRFHDPAVLEESFSDAGFECVDITDHNDRALIHVTK